MGAGINEPVEHQTPAVLEIDILIICETFMVFIVKSVNGLIGFFEMVHEQRILIRVAVPQEYLF